MKLQPLFSALALSLTLAACTTLDTQRPTEVSTIPNTDQRWQQHLQQIKQIRTYAANGQLGYISPSERFSSRFDWHYQNPTAYKLHLSSTISASTLTLEMRPSGMTISDNQGRQRSQQDARALLKDIIGMDFPLEQFSQWLKGQPDESANYQVGSNHLLANFSYPIDGQTWTADYLSYHTEKQPPLPREILLKNQNQTLKIRVDNWIY